MTEVLRLLSLLPVVVVSVVTGMMSMILSPCVSLAEAPSVLRQENLVAWCIVPFDAKKRTPAERALMLKELGILRCAYDWREEHVPTFEEEILEYQKHGIEFFAFWGFHESAFRLFEKYRLKPQIWITLGDSGQETQEQKVETAVERLLSLAERAQKLGSRLGLYNHGGWGGEPANLVAVCQRLHDLGHDHVGIVYNFHHGHDEIEHWGKSFALMKPYLICLNLNGMNSRAAPKILGIGKGQHELEMIRIVAESDYSGPIGILNHRTELDAREGLIENRDGLNGIRQEIEKSSSGGSASSKSGAASCCREGENCPLSSSSRPAEGKSLEKPLLLTKLMAGDEAYRQPTITVDCLATLDSSGQYNILVASDTKQSSDHWEIFSMPGSGHLTVYLPGYLPDHIRTSEDICDGRPHVITMIYEPERVRLYADTRLVADQAVTRVKTHKQPGGFAIGQLVEGHYPADGHIDWVRISRGVRDRDSGMPLLPETTLSKDDQTIELWIFPPRSGQLDGRGQTSPLPPYDPDTITKLLAHAENYGDAVRGAVVFTHAKWGCISCHRVGSPGATVGPELTTIASQLEPEQIVESLLWPSRTVKPEYIAWQWITIEGKIVSGYKHSENEEQVVVRDPASGVLTTLLRDEIDDEVAGSTVMPAGLTAGMTEQQQWDLIRFLCELKSTPHPQQAQIEQILSQPHQHGPVGFPLVTSPLSPEHWPNSHHFVNRDRLYDFYTRQAEHFRGQVTTPLLLTAYPGLDGGNQGHWGNQDETTWANSDWSQMDLGSLQAGIFFSDQHRIPRGICVRLGEHQELSVCFNPDRLTYDVLWKGGFLEFSSVRHGFLSGMRPAGELLPISPQNPPADNFQYLGFYRDGSRVVFSYRMGGVDYLDAPWVKNGQFVREVAPVAEHSLRRILQGGTQQWPQVITTDILPGTGRPYAVDTISLPVDNPWNSLMFLGGHDFLSDGTAYVCTMQGDVWHVCGLDSPPGQLGKAQWKRFAAGLNQPQGLVVSAGQVYVQCRDQLVRLTDFNQDGEADFYECFSNAFATSASGHDFICGLQRDSAGNFYTASSNQGAIRISPDGKNINVLATGIRNPDGLGLLPDGTVTLPSSEGDWIPASMVCAVNPSKMKSGHPLHFGHRGPKGSQLPDLPLVYLPRGIDNSSGEQVYVSSRNWGPLHQQLVHLSFGMGSTFVLLQNEVAGQLQGAIVPMSGDFLSGVHRGRFHPVDGQLYVTGMDGWGTYTSEAGCFQRLRYTGEPVQLPTAFHPHENGIIVSFAEAVDPQVAGETGSHFAQCWNYRYSGAYGSPEYSPSHPGVPGHDPLRIAAVHLLEDGKSLFLEIPELQPVNQLHLRMHVNKPEEIATISPAGSGHDLFVTVHQLDAPFTNYPGYQPRPKTIAAHPMLTDLAMNAKRRENPWKTPLASARPLTLATGSNLTYETRELYATAGEPIALTLNNPDAVPHNWVLVRPGTLAVVGELSNQLIADPEAYVRQYIPQTRDVLIFTDIVQAGEKQTLYFYAPQTPGKYPFLCTFPGHWMVMNGTLIVE